MKYGKYFAIAVIAIFVSCGESSNSNMDDSQDTELVDTSLTGSKVRNIFYSVPSPVELAQIIENSGANYNSDLLNDINNVSKYTTSLARAYALGVYGADLAFTSIFDQTQESMLYVKCTSAMAEALGVSTAFNNETVSRMDANKGNRDSLLSIITESYYETDAYLRENQRGNISAIVMAGGWIEALHLSCQLSVETNNKAIKKRVGEMKGSLDNLIGLCEVYKGMEGIDAVVSDLNALKDIYNQIKVESTPVSSTTDDENKVTTLSGGSSYELSDELLKKIAEKTNEIRTRIIRMQ